MTLREVEHYLVNFIVNNYHQCVHSQLDAAPIKVWEDAIPAMRSPVWVECCRRSRPGSYGLPSLLPSHGAAVRRAN